MLNKKDRTKIKLQAISIIEMLDKIQKMTNNENEVNMTKNIENVKKSLENLIKLN